MKYRSLGRTGVKVSPLCLGCMMWSRMTDPEEAYKIIDHAIYKGINFIDTANVYGRGRSEEITGEVLSENGMRDKVILATKVHGRMREGDPNAHGNTRRHIIEQCEASLRRLKTDYIDLYQIHRPQSDVPIDETLRALDDLIRTGKVRYIGTSTFAAWQIVESLWAADKLRLNRFVCEQPPYNLLERSIERELLPMARTYGLGIMPWGPLSGGILTGKYKRGDEPPPESRLYRNERLRERLTDKVFDVLEQLEALAQEKECTLSQLALAWNMHQPGVTGPIIGPRTFEQLEDNLKALEVKITDEDTISINKIVPPKESIVGYPQADWGPHKYRW